MTRRGANERIRLVDLYVRRHDRLGGAARLVVGHGIAIIWAAWNFQRYVETRMGTLKAEGGVGTFDTAADEKGKADEAVDKAKRDAQKVDVDKFVE